MTKIKFIIIVLFTCVLYGQKEEKKIAYFWQDHLFKLDASLVYDLDEIDKKMDSLMIAAKNNFGIVDYKKLKEKDRNVDINKIYDFHMKEAALLHSICYYDLKKYKKDLLLLRNKHKEKYDEEMQREALRLKSLPPRTRVYKTINLHSIYLFIDDYVLPSMDTGVRKDYFINCHRYGGLLFFTEKEKEEFTDCFSFYRSRKAKE